MGKSRLLRKLCIILAMWVATAIASPAQSLAPLYSFDGANADPTSGVIQGTDGNFYGTTVGGGNAGGSGTVFKLTPSGALTTLYSFCAQANCTDGALPGRMIQAADGNFYGITSWGGTSSYCYVDVGCGTVFELTASGTFSTLYNFCSQSGCSDGAGPLGVIQAADGNFYGVTSGLGCFAKVCGSIFELTPGGTLTNLYTSGEGESPSWLIQATDGNFYGTMALGGSTGDGSVFKITPGGVLTTVYSFCAESNCQDGGGPYNGVIQAADGNFYGTTCCLGAHKRGTVFELTPSGTLTTVYTFCSLPSCADGGQPTWLIQAADGNFYGTTQYGPPRKTGTIFEILPGGTLATLYAFSDLPSTGLMQAANGNFYGTASTTFADNGMVFTFGRPSATLSKPYIFGDVALNETSRAETVTLTSSGTLLLTFNTITVSGNFAISSNTCAGAALTGGKNCKVGVTFTPAVLGPQTGTLTFTDGALNSPQTMTLSGTGVAQATLTPGSYTFSKTKVGSTSAAHNVTLKNNLSTTLTGISYSTTGDFGISTSTCGTALDAKTSCRISVTFTPTQTGARTGQLSVSDGAGNSPQMTSLTGTGD